MVRAVLHTVDRNVPVILSRLARQDGPGRAVSALYGYERDGSWHKDQVRHAGELRARGPDAELLTAGYRRPVPDRVDAWCGP